MKGTGRFSPRVSKARQLKAEPLKILIVTDAWAPQINGVVRTLEVLGKELDALGHEVRYATPEGRWRPYTYDEILGRDKVSLDLFWLRDESLEDSASLPEPHLLAQEIADDLRSALAQIEDVLGDRELRVDAGAVEDA